MKSHGTGTVVQRLEIGGVSGTQRITDVGKNTLNCEEPWDSLSGHSDNLQPPISVSVLLAERPDAATGKYPFLGAVVLVNPTLGYDNTPIRQKPSDDVPFEISPEGALTSPET